MTIFEVSSFFVPGEGFGGGGISGGCRWIRDAKRPVDGLISVCVSFSVTDGGGFNSQSGLKKIQGLHLAYGDVLRVGCNSYEQVLNPP